VILNSHSSVRAPHELHLRTLRVQVPKAFTEPAMTALGLDQRELEHLLWDRLLDRELRRSGKSVIVDKTPTNAFMWERIVECWPEARFIVLLRHPAAIVDSLARARPESSVDRVEREVLSYAQAVEAARTHLVAHIIRYETLVTSPAAVLLDVCEHLGVGWEPAILEYGEFDHGALRAGLGDWGEQIRSGRIHEARKLPTAALSCPELRALVGVWGYPLGDGPVSTGSAADVAGRPGRRIAGTLQSCTPVEDGFPVLPLPAVVDSVKSTKSSGKSSVRSRASKPTLPRAEKT